MEEEEVGREEGAGREQAGRDQRGSRQAGRRAVRSGSEEDHAREQAGIW
jgi:hypothetical protein